MAYHLYQQVPVSRRSKVIASLIATKTHDDTERQLVHKPVHAIVLIVSICSLDRGGGLCSPLSSRAGPAAHHCKASLTEAGLAHWQAVT